ncbi:MAG TPA: hypothetical protein VEK79_25060, partial [Thermoanaerobaculia bacterium]|nr:hypothetical protein [Thermoanaerobaculia bacterium]
MREALQRRASKQPGDSFNGKLAGEDESVFLAMHFGLFQLARIENIENPRRWPVQPPRVCSGVRTIARQALHHPTDLTTDCPDASCCFYASAERCACRSEQSSWRSGERAIDDLWSLSSDGQLDGSVCNMPAEWKLNRSGT